RLNIFVRIQHRRRSARETESIAALGESESGRMKPDLSLAGCVLSAIEHVDFSVPDYCRGIERRELFPAHDAVGHRRKKCRGCVWRDDWIDPTRFLEWAEHPILVLRRCWRGSEYRHQEKQHGHRCSGHEQKCA